jgi:SAM-dependent methyltransferase
MKLHAQAHAKYVHSRRVKTLVQHLAPLIPPNSSVLDVGTGDGLLASQIASARSDCQIRGVDVLIRENTAIPVAHFDGVKLPDADESVDVVMFVDVLHHTDDPEAQLKEASRVGRRAIIIKDHLREGVLAGPTLRFMDWVGNSPHGVVLPYNYLTNQQWQDIFRRLNLTVDSWQTRLGLYPRPADWLFGRSLHFVARLLINR